MTGAQLAVKDERGVHDLSEGRPGGLRVAFAHGLEDVWASWKPVARRLDPAWRLVALDLPWRAGNDYRWRRQDSPAGWLRAGLDAVGGPVDVVVAHSFGANALLDLCCAGARPAAAVVLVCPLYRPPAVPVTWRLLDRSRRNFEAHIHDGVRARLGGRAAALDPDVLTAMMAKALDRVGPAGLLAVFEQFVASADLPLTRVTPPALVLAGGADPTLSAAAAGALAGGIPGAVLRLNDHFDHFCHIRDPDAVAAQLSEFLRVAVPAAPHQTEGGAR